MKKIIYIIIILNGLLFFVSCSYISDDYRMKNLGIAVGSENQESSKGYFEDLGRELYKDNILLAVESDGINYVSKQPRSIGFDRIMEHDKVRDLIVEWGERDMEYHVVFPKFKNSGGVIFWNLSAMNNILYSYSYIVNFPAKLIHYTIEDYSIYGFKNGTIYFLFDLFELIVGIVCSIVFGIIGIIIGLLTMPLQSLYDFFPALLDIVITTWHAIRNIFMW